MVLESKSSDPNFEHLVEGCFSLILRNFSFVRSFMLFLPIAGILAQGKDQLLGISDPELAGLKLFSGALILEAM